MCLHTIVLDPRGEDRMFAAISAAVSELQAAETVAARTIRRRWVASRSAGARPHIDLTWRLTLFTIADNVSRDLAKRPPGGAVRGHSKRDP